MVRQKYQLKTKSAEIVTFSRGQLLRFSIVLNQNFRLNGCKLAIFVHKQIACFFVRQISQLQRGTVWHFVLATSIPWSLKGERGNGVVPRSMPHDLSKF